MGAYSTCTISQDNYYNVYCMYSNMITTLLYISICNSSSKSALYNKERKWLMHEHNYLHVYLYM